MLLNRKNPKSEIKNKKSKNQKPSLSPNQTRDLSQSSKHYVPSTGTITQCGTAHQTSKFLCLPKLPCEHSSMTRTDRGMTQLIPNNPKSIDHITSYMTMKRWSTNSPSLLHIQSPNNFILHNQLEKPSHFQDTKSHKKKMIWDISFQISQLPNGRFRYPKRKHYRFTF